ncbi:MAG: ATP-binding cassette domain-containing protein [Euryarchaeota archaeon]|nr:ATP-binding cassette domain-containing protein [Euryarchaeota archaeon]
MKVETNGFTRTFKGAGGVNDVDLAIPSGEVVSVIGPSGAGKTTLLKGILGLLSAERGSVRLDGRMDDEIRLQAAAVFQRPALFSGTVADNVGYGLALRGIDRYERRQRVARALELVGLAGFEDRKARTLSGGEGQRVAFARAIVYDPRLLVLDEFTANLDPPNAAILEKAALGFAKTHRATIIASSHDHHQVRRMAERVIVLTMGQVADDGPPERIFSAPSMMAAPFILGKLPG